MDDRVVGAYRVLGRVQGVGFRWWCKSEANELGLVGNVRNEADGSVTVVVQGPPEAVEAMRDRLAAGPPFARVKAVAPFDPPDHRASPGAVDFQILR